MKLLIFCDLRGVLLAYLERHGARVFYQSFEDCAEDGGSPLSAWVTLVNGYTRSASDFRLLAKDLNAMGWRCVALDNRGAGRTETQREIFTFDDWLKDVEAVWQELGITTTHLLGISMGGFICQHLALRENEHTKIMKLVLVSTAFAKEAVNEPMAWEADLNAIQTKLISYFTPDFLRRNELLVNAMAKQILQEINDNRFIERARMQKQALATMVPLPQSAEKYATLPVLVLHGDQDKIIPLREAEKLHGIWQRSEMKVLQGAGHLLLAERAKELRTEVGDFLQE